MKERLDVLLVQRNLAPSREKAKALIMEGNVYVNEQKEDKAGAGIDTEAVIEVRGSTLAYVSRGGLKLEKAIRQFGLFLEGLVCDMPRVPFTVSISKDSPHGKDFSPTRPSFASSKYLAR